jgi:uncharacterized membrane protein YcjF (UPF0283 family)
VLLAGWAAVDAAAWISTAFDHGVAPGVLAAAAVVAGVGGAGAIIVREAVSLLRLRSVEAVRRRFSDTKLAPAQTCEAVREVLAVLPRRGDRDLAPFQRQVRPRADSQIGSHRSVLKPLDIRHRCMHRSRRWIGDQSRGADRCGIFLACAA